MTTQDIALIREIISKAKNADIGKLALDFADEIDKLKLEKADKNDEKASFTSGISIWDMLFHNNSFGELRNSLWLMLLSGMMNVISILLKIAGMITRKKYVQPIYKNIEKSLILKGDTLKQQLDEFYISKMLNDLPDELSESLDIYTLQDYLDDTKLDKIVSSVFYKFDDLVSKIECQDFLSAFSESDDIIEELQKLKEEAKKLPECVKEYEQTIKKVEKKIERDEKADVVCFNNLQKYGLEFKDGWAVDKDGKRIVEAKNFRSIYWTGMHLGYLKLYDKYEKLFMDKDGNIFRQLPCVNPKKIYTMKEFVECGRYGVMDVYENIIIPPRYNWIDILSDEAIKVKKYGKYGLFDKNGKNIIPVKLERFDKIKETENFIVQRKSGKAGIINSKGEIILDMEFDHIIESRFDYDKYVIALVKGDSVTFVDEYLNEIKEHNFYIDRNVVYEKYSYQDENSNQVVLDNLYIYEQKGNLYIVKDSSKYERIVMNSKGEVLGKGYVDFFGDNFFVRKDNDLSIFNNKGEILKSLECNYCCTRDKNLEIHVDGKLGIMALDLSITDVVYGCDPVPINGFGFNARLGDKRYLISSDLKTIMEHDFGYCVDVIWENILLAQKNNECYLLDFNCKILPQSYYFEIPKDYLKG
jgi:hypothetical protein